MIRPIRPDELATFASLPGHAERNVSVRAYVERMTASGAMRPDWCFVSEVEGRLVGSIALWMLPGTDIPRSLVLLEAPWKRRNDTTGDELLRHALSEVRRLGARTIDYVLDDPPLAPQWQDHPEQRVALLVRHGFVLKRETNRFRRSGYVPVGASTRLTFRDLDAVGEDAFLDAIFQVSEGTLDQEIEEERRRDGQVAAARALFDLLRKLGYQPAWWELAYTPAGNLAGLVMPATPGVATIGYIGVVPSQRGRGYVNDLLARAAATLHAGGHDEIVADTDLRNTPMAAAFVRAGYAQFATRREFGWVDPERL